MPHNEDSSEKKKLSREEYNSIINGMELQELFLIKGNFYLNSEHLAEKSSVNINTSAVLEKIDEEKSIVIHKYELKVSDKDSKKNLLKINANYKLVFFTEKKFSEEFFEVFKNANLPINTWPYFREYVNNITFRMNLPPLTLPLFKGKALKKKKKSS